MSNARPFRRQSARSGAVARRLRNEANRTGVCPDCGARLRAREIEPGVLSGSFDHDDKCRALRGTRADRAMGRLLEGGHTKR